MVVVPLVALVLPAGVCGAIRCPKLAARDEMDFGTKPKKDTSSEAPRAAARAAAGRGHHLSGVGPDGRLDLSSNMYDIHRAVGFYGPGEPRGPGKAGAGQAIGRGQAHKHPDRARGQASSVHDKVYPIRRLGHLDWRQ